MSKILLIGSRNNRVDSSQTGGVTILFELLRSELKDRDIAFTTIDTLKANHNNSGLRTFVMAVYEMMKYVPRHHSISLQATPNSFLYLAPIAVVLCKLFRKPLSIRLFAGDFFELYEAYTPLKKRMVRFGLKHANQLFFELKSLVEEAQNYNKNTYWFPNVRSQSIQKFHTKKFRRRFVYIGSINQEKGIDELCAVIPKLKGDFTVDLYGPLKYEHENYSTSYFAKRNIAYKGALKAEEVLETMAQYDVLVLPSHREGYPGVIIEAFSQGMPVIATKLPGIMEMCRHGVDSILIEAQEEEQLLEAMLSLNEKQYQTLQEGARSAFSNFNSSRQTDLFLERIGYVNENQRGRS